MNSTEESVTLTKSQLWAILEAIGQPSGHTSSEESKRNSPSEKLKSTEVQNKDDIELIKQRQSDHYPPWPPETSIDNMPTKLSTPLVNGTSRINRRMLSPTESVSSKSTMSKLEQKRLQWERERAEMQEWNPWGRPGAGAPPRKTQQVVAVAPMTESQLLMVHTNNLQPSGENSRISTCVPSHSYTLRTVPPAMRSSITFGTNSYTTEEETERMRREWLHDMEHDHKVREISGWLGDTALSENGTWAADHMTKSSTEPRSFIRGHGQILDSATAAEVNERHQKALEYQQAIRAQMEEKARRRREEHLQRLKEEQDEEKRLEEERARLHLQYEQEQQKIKEKEEQERKKREALIAAMEEAHAAAEAAKKARKSKRSSPSQNSSANTVKQAPVSTSVTPTLTVPISSHSPALQTSEAIQPQDLPIQKVVPRPPQLSVSVHQVQPAETNASTFALLDNQETFPKIAHEIGVQARLPTPAFLPYVQNRILTPSRLRMELRQGSRGRGRDHGTQTELSFPSSLLKELSNNASSSQSSSLESSPTHVPVTSGKGQPLKATWKNSRPVEERPKWGANKPQKPFVKNTEKDHRYEQHKMFQTLRKQHWEKEMAQRNKKSESRRYRTDDNKTPTAQWVTSSESEPRSASPTPQNTDQELNEHQSKSKEPRENSHTTFTISHRTRSYSLENIPSSTGASDARCSHCQNSLPRIGNKTNSLPVERRKWHSQDMYSPTRITVDRMPGASNAIPSIHATTNDESGLAPNARRKWRDQESFDLENVALSKAVTHRRHSLTNDVDATDDVPNNEGPDGVRRYRRHSPKNPLLNPEVVMSQPTPRQDKILQQLAILRHGLLQKQRELDNILFSRERVS